MLNHSSPYASFLVAKCSLGAPDHPALVQALLGCSRPKGGWVQENDLIPPPYAGIATTVAYHLVENTLPKWCGPGAPSLDTLNHLLAIFINEDCAVIYSSSPDVKESIFDALDSGGILSWAPIEENVLLHAYVTGRALRMLWLAGTHRNVTVKPKSKLLTGDYLADVIDPFGDSTFMAGALRAEKAGVSLKRSGVWFGKKKDWTEFCLVARSVLSAVQISSAHPGLDDVVVHEGLAQILRTFKGVGPISDIEWMPFESMSSERRQEKLQALSEDFEISVTVPLLINQDFSICILHIPTGNTADAMVVPTLTGKKISLNVKLNKKQLDCQPCADAITKNPDFIRILYNSGHAIAGGRLTYSTIQDRDFTIDFADFVLGAVPQYDIWQEKPPGTPPPLANMFTAADRSLFKWVFKEGLGQLGLQQPTPGFCWLYCDDRSGEVADFIHLYVPGGGATPQTTLIHVKGAQSKNNKSRNISTSAYEVVVGQAMKNLRRMAWSELSKAIKETVTTHGADRVWDGPWVIGLAGSAAAGTAMLAAIDGIGANCEYEVIVVQPHVQQSKYLPGGVRASGANASQLRNLLFTAKAAANVALAKFRVISALG